MIQTKSKTLRQIVVDDKNYRMLHDRYGAGKSFNDVITEILKHHESAVSIMTDCPHCRDLFRAAIQR